MSGECSALTDGGVVHLRYLECIFGNIVSIAIGLAGVAFFVMLIVGGFKYMTAGGDPKAVQGAQGTLTMAILGLTLVAMAYLILLVIGKITGVDLTIFKIYQQ